MAFDLILRQSRNAKFNGQGHELSLMNVKWSKNGSYCKSKTKLEKKNKDGSFIYGHKLRFKHRQKLELD